MTIPTLGERESESAGQRAKEEDAQFFVKQLGKYETIVDHYKSNPSEISKNRADLRKVEDELLNLTLDSLQTRFGRGFGQFLYDQKQKITNDLTKLMLEN